MYYLWLNGKILRRFKDFSKAKLFAFKYVKENNLNHEIDEFEIDNPCEKDFIPINVFKMTYNIL